MKHLGQFVYSVIIQNETESGPTVSTYTHEDGIRKKREEHTGDDHPVHKIVCLTDLYDIAQPIENFVGLSSFAANLLNENPAE
ncbi:MAG: hypothetical protein K8S54_03690 [Spirochaetia bacterium]|nr:hypothetical protein [Spirochaetia bacterium]